MPRRSALTGTTYIQVIQVTVTCYTVEKLLGSAFAIKCLKACKLAKSVPNAARLFHIRITRSEKK
jgi:hypothetical protein